MERDGRLEMDWHDLLFLLKHKQWDIFWQLIFFFFLDMLLGKRNNLFESDLFNSCPKKDKFRELIAPFFRNHIKTSDIYVQLLPEGRGWSRIFVLSKLHKI